MLTEAFATLEAGYIAGWRNSPARDQDGRERLWQAVQIVGLVRTHLEMAMANGDIAQAALNDIGRTTSAYRK